MSDPGKLHHLSTILERYRTPRSYHRIDQRQAHDGKQVNELRLDLRSLDAAALFDLEVWRRDVLGEAPLDFDVPDSIWYKRDSEEQVKRVAKKRRGKPSRTSTTIKVVAESSDTMMPDADATGDAGLVEGSRVNRHAGSQVHQQAVWQTISGDPSIASLGDSSRNGELVIGDAGTCPAHDIVPNADATSASDEENCAGDDIETALAATHAATPPRPDSRATDELLGNQDHSDDNRALKTSPQFSEPRAYCLGDSPPSLKRSPSSDLSPPPPIRRRTRLEGVVLTTQQQRLPQPDQRP